MFKNTYLKRFSPILGLIVVLLLLLIFTEIAHAVIRNNKISGNLTVGGKVLDFKISPDGQYTVFRGDVLENDKNELFSVRTVGGPRVQLSIDLPDECGIGGFLITPDSQRVVYYGEGDNHCIILHSVPIGGGPSIELNQAYDDSYPSNIRVTNDSANVLFVLVSSETRQRKLYRVPIIGGPIQPISSAWYVGIIEYEITPNNQSVIYVQDPWPNPGNKELFKASLVGDHTPRSLEVGEIDRFVKISPDGAYVIYRKHTGSGYELFSIPIESYPVSPIKLNGTLVAGGSVSSFQITPDSAYVVYKADETTRYMNLLYRAPVNGSTHRIPLITDTFADPLKSVYLFEISSDGQWVVFSGDLEMDNRYDLYSVSINGGTKERLNKGMIDTGDVINFKISPNSIGVVFIASYYFVGVNELFAVNMAGNWGVRLNTDLPPGGNVSNFRISNNSQNVVYRADQEIDSVFNLYVVPSTGGTTYKINPEMVPGGSVRLYQITPNDRGVVYLADQDVDTVDELFITYDYDVNYLPLVIR
ncbi:MAG: hypothetical protein K0B06_06745 [Brevefilum sp.]|nr:hypothetical protein [Brevefilum sp.]